MAELRNQSAAALMQIDSNIAITLTYNDRISLNKMQSDLTKFRSRLDRLLYGSKYHKKPRTRGWAVVEGLPDVGHLHCGLCIPPDKICLLVNLIPIWKKFAPSGEIDIQSIYKSADSTWEQYCTKELTTTDRITFF